MGFGSFKQTLFSATTLLICIVCFFGCRVDPPVPEPPVDALVKGVDFSQLPKIQDAGYTFYNADSIEQHPLDILTEAGINTVRLKLWNTPSGDASMSECRQYAQELQNRDLELLLTLHYSDTWADPGAQILPQNWANASFEDVLDSVEAFTSSAVSLLKPTFVQIGNEINHGLIYPHGKRDGSGNFQRLLQRGIQGARSADSNAITMLHFAGFEGANAFFQSVDSLDYDAIALSFYPRWHTKDLDEFEAACWQLQNTFQRPVYIVETSYAFSLGWADWTNNHIGSADQLIPSFPPTPQGQKEFVSAVKQIADSLGTGVLYWGAELVAYDGPQSQNGSPYENQALFNFNGVALPALTALGATAP